MLFCFFTYTATTEIYTYCHTISLHDALPVAGGPVPIEDVAPGGRLVLRRDDQLPKGRRALCGPLDHHADHGSTWAPQSLDRPSYGGDERKPHTRSLCGRAGGTRPEGAARNRRRGQTALAGEIRLRSEEHTSELQSLMRISYAVFCLIKNKKKQR